VLGKPSDQNGVSIGNNTNEASSKYEVTGTADSPDGVIYNCRYDMNRLKENSLAIATALDGSLIADLRASDTAISSLSIYNLEVRAYNLEMLTAVAFGAKTYMLPGGTVYWNDAWPANEKGSKMQSALYDFLADQEVFPH
jgi:hypothetical protein